MLTTNDAIIRTALIKELQKYNSDNFQSKILQELGIDHGVVRVDIAVVGDVMHGYEIKSDADNLSRLPNQLEIYNSVFSQVTLVVGRVHLYDAINIIPDWWGIVVAKIDSDNCVIFHTIRESDVNPKKDSESIARLLWRNEALEILEELNAAEGFRWKTRDIIYKRLVQLLDQQTLETEVKQRLLFRPNWRVDRQPVLNDD